MCLYMGAREKKWEWYTKRAREKKESDERYQEREREEEVTLVHLYILLLREGVGRDVAWGGVLKDGALALVLSAGVLGQEGERWVDGGGMLLQIVLFVARQTIAHIVRCVRKIIKELSRILQKKM